MSFTAVPAANSAPPVETWMIPSLPASANPLRAALTDTEEVMLIAGYAKPPSLARSSMAEYVSEVARGMAVVPSAALDCDPRLSIPQKRAAGRASGRRPQDSGGAASTSARREGLRATARP